MVEGLPHHTVEGLSYLIVSTRGNQTRKTEVLSTHLAYLAPSFSLFWHRDGATDPNQHHEPLSSSMRAPIQSSGKGGLDRAISPAVATASPVSDV